MSMNRTSIITTGPHQAGLSRLTARPVLYAGMAYYAICSNGSHHEAARGLIFEGGGGQNEHS
jgi:hypothetical protein